MVSSGRPGCFGHMTPSTFGEMNPDGIGALELGYLVSDDAVALAEEGAELARRAGFRAAARAEVEAQTWQSVVEVADEMAASVIVPGSRGLTGIHERLEGSVSHDVAEHAGRPVLIVPPPNAVR